MASRKSGTVRFIPSQIRAVHSALTDIVSIVNRPQVDAMMVRESGIVLDRALFPLLVRIERRGPIGVVDLAGQVGRDYTTVSRQVAKLENLGLIQRQHNAQDRRIREAVVTPTGKAMTDAVDATRERISQAMFSKWDRAEVDNLVHLLQKLAIDMSQYHSDTG